MVVGLPIVVTVKVKALPVLAVSVAALVKVGTGTVVPAALTVRVKLWLTDVAPLLAVNVTVVVPATVVEPDNVPVPLPLAPGAKVTPVGRLSLSRCFH